MAHGNYTLAERKIQMISHTMTDHISSGKHIILILWAGITGSTTGSITKKTVENEFILSIADWGIVFGIIGVCFAGYNILMTQHLARKKDKREQAEYELRMRKLRNDED